MRAMRPHSELALGDCSYLNTCHRVDTCRYVHWALEDPGPSSTLEPNPSSGDKGKRKQVRLFSGCASRADAVQLPPQWINVDLRSFDVSVLGKFDVVVADPPWAIHQEVRCPFCVEQR